MRFPIATDACDLRPPGAGSGSSLTSEPSVRREHLVRAGGSSSSEYDETGRGAG